MPLVIVNVSTIVHEIHTKAYDVHLSDQLAAKTEREILIVELGERLERGVTGRNHNGVHLTDALEQRMDRDWIGDIDLLARLVLTREYQLVTTLQRSRDGQPDGARGTMMSMRMQG